MNVTDRSDVLDGLCAQNHMPQKSYFHSNFILMHLSGRRGADDSPAESSGAESSWKGETGAGVIDILAVSGCGLSGAADDDSAAAADSAALAPAADSAVPLSKGEGRDCLVLSSPDSAACTDSAHGQIHMLSAGAVKS